MNRHHGVVQKAAAGGAGNTQMLRQHGRILRRELHLVVAAVDEQGVDPIEALELAAGVVQLHLVEIAVAQKPELQRALFPVELHACHKGAPQRFAGALIF